MIDGINFLVNDDLNGLYGPPGEPVLRAIKTHLTDFHIDYLRQATFFVLSTGNGTGLDASPRGGVDKNKTRLPQATPIIFATNVFYTRLYS